MRKEIENLLKKKNGKLQINEICYLNRETKNCMDEECDLLQLCFKTTKKYYFKSVLIISRNYDQIIKEIKNAIKNY